jgi:predicted transposase YdaD
MPKHFDAVLKHLVEAYPASWLAAAGLPAAGDVEVVDADVSTVTAGADKVIRVNAVAPWLLHVELQAGPETELADRVHLYNTLLRWRHGCPVRSVIVLLRRQADSPRLTGLLEHLDPVGDWERRFRYRVVRVWQLPAEALLTGGLGSLPLTPVSAVTEPELPEVLHRMKQRLDREVQEPERRTLWAATYFLMGLRYPPALAGQLLQEVQNMEESSTYQAVLSKEARRILLRMGRKRFGPPDEATTAAIQAIEDVNRLEELSERLLDVSSWQELLATP